MNRHFHVLYDLAALVQRCLTLVHSILSVKQIGWTLAGLSSAIQYQSNFQQELQAVTLLTIMDIAWLCAYYILVF